MHVRGYKEKGTTTTPSDIAVMNDMDRYHLAVDVVDRLPRLQNTVAHFKQLLRDKLIDHKRHVMRYGG